MERFEGRYLCGSLCGTGAYKGRYFCPTCGPAVFGRFDDEVGINPGALDDPDLLTPTYELWTVSRDAWLPEFVGVKGYEWERVE